MAATAEASSVKPVDLATGAGRKTVQSLRDGEDFEATIESYQETDQFRNYIERGDEPLVRIGKTLIFPLQMQYHAGYGGYEGSTLLAIQNGVVGMFRAEDILDIDAGDLKRLTDDLPCGVIVPTEKRNPDTKGQKYVVLLNGDEDGNDINRELSDLDGNPTVSFDCLTRFFNYKPKSGKSAEWQVAERLASGKLQVVDFTSDSRKPASKEDRAAFKAIQTARSNGTKTTKKPPKSPEAGYTYTGGEWHRAATVLFHDTETQKAILIGQDEGTYFGVEMATLPATIKDAYTDLMPEGARNKAGVVRQGEWFAVPVDNDEVPKKEEAIALSSSDMTLPIDHPEANEHHVNSDDIRVSKEGVIYAESPSVEHSAGEHETLRAEGWVKFLRNTALRSFSVAGVD